MFIHFLHYILQFTNHQFQWIIYIFILHIHPLFLLLEFTPISMFSPQIFSTPPPRLPENIELMLKHPTNMAWQRKLRIQRGFLLGEEKTGWWLNQPIWKICASRQIIAFPQKSGINMEKKWNHHLVIDISDNFMKFWLVILILPEKTHMVYFGGNKKSLIFLQGGLKVNSYK